MTKKPTKSPAKKTGRRAGKAAYDQRKPTAKPRPKAAPKKKAGPAHKLKPKTTDRHWMRSVINWGGTAILWGMLLVGIVLGYYAYNLPDISGINVIEKRPSMELTSRNGVRFASYGDLYGTMLTPEQIPTVMKQAVLATEDAQFYKHFGVNPVSLVRAMWRNYQAGRVVEGGSTITQQLAKNLFLTPKRSLKRKIREVLLAFWLEANYTKEEILALYLNRMYFGSGTFGIDAATRKYFSKSIDKLTTAEAALLAGLLKAPTYYAPTVSLKRAQKRSTVVIRRMQAVGYLSKAEADKLVKNPAKLRHAGRNFKNVRYFSDWVVSEVRSFIGRTDQDLEILTTLDLRLQKEAELAIEAQLAKNSKKYKVKQAALVALEPDGAVRAMVGGRSYSASVFNRATSARRQPGSVFKTIVYTAAFEKGRSPDDIYLDAPLNIDGWKPSNYTRRYAGEMTLRQAYAKSINTVAIRLSEDIGRDAVAKMAIKMGLSGKMTPHPSIALGTSEVTLLEMSAAYAVLANDGRAVLPFAVQEIRTKQGDILYRRQSSGLGRLISGTTVNKMRDIMTTVIRSGTGRAANPGFAAAGKTGTTQDYRDAWFIGFTPRLVTGVWFGNDNGAPTRKVTGGNLPARTWRTFITRAFPEKNQPVFAKVSEQAAPDSQQSIWDKIVRTFGGSNSPTSSGQTGSTRTNGSTQNAFPPNDDQRP